MIQSDWQALERLLRKLTAEEARQLVSQLEQSLRESDAHDANQSQSAAWVQVLAELASLPREQSADTFCGTDHDPLLYGQGT